MIEIALLAGFAALTLAAFWQEIVDWIQKAVSDIKRMIEGILHGVKVFVKKVGEAFREIAKYYSKSGTQWTVTTQTKLVDEYDVPSEIRERAKYTDELDITDELQMELA